MTIQPLLVAPLQLSGFLNGYPREELTPAIGTQFSPSLQLAEVLRLPPTERDGILRDLAVLCSHRGVLFLPAQDELTKEDLATLGIALGELSGKPSSSGLHIHPTQELKENGLPIGTISNKPDATGRQISFLDERSTLASSGWHSDVSFEVVPSAYTILRMHTLPKTGGDTLWNSCHSTYDALTPPLAALLEKLTATHSGERFRTQSQLNGFKLHVDPRGSPENVGDLLTANHPVIRTNPVTGLKAVFVNREFTVRLNELSIDESQVLLDYLLRLQAESHDAHVKYRWTRNTVAIWDNRSVTHLPTFDFTDERAGDRVVVLGEKPYLDPSSFGRKEWLKTNAVVV